MDEDIGTKLSIFYTCSLNFNHEIIDMMDLVNSTVLPFIGMFILSIALIICVYRSRSRINSNTNRFAISSISLNVMFFILTLPIVLYYMIANEDSIISNFSNFLFYSYFALGFYMQIIVNRDFKN